MSRQPVVTLPFEATSDDRGERVAALFDTYKDRRYRLAFADAGTVRCGKSV
jgi:hypothetical protein